MSDIGGDISSTGGNAGWDTDPTEYSGDVINPAAIGTSDATSAGSSGAGFNTGGSSGTRRRGRPPGSRNASPGNASDAKPRATGSQTKAALSVDVLTGTLMSLHLMASAVCKIPELQLEAEEAESIAKAGAEVMRFYPDAVMGPKSIAWTGLISTLGMVYMPRMVAVRMRVTDAKRNRTASPKAATVHDFETGNVIV